MKNIARVIGLTLLAGGVSIVPASPVCPTTSTTTSDCDFLVTVGASGTASISDVPGSSPFNGPITFADGTGDPGGDGALVGVVNNSAQALASFTLSGSGASAGIFDFSFNGICAYTDAAYCGTAAAGYEGPTTTFGGLESTILFETNKGTVTFDPTLASGASTYFSIEDSASDINANGGLAVSDLTFAPGTATPEPAGLALSGLGVSALSLFRRKRPAA